MPRLVIVRRRVRAQTGRWQHLGASRVLCAPESCAGNIAIGRKSGGRERHAVEASELSMQEL